jgi:hypothetical protein
MILIAINVTLYAVVALGAVTQAIHLRRVQRA